MKKKNKIKIIVNGKQMTVNLKFSIKNLIDKLKMPISKVAIELNKEIINKKNINKIILKNRDKLEIVHFIGGGDAVNDQDGDSGDDIWTVAGRKMTSRLIIGTGKYESYDQNRRAAEAAGAEMVTVALGTWGGEVRLLTIIKLSVPTDSFSPFYNDPYAAQHVEPWLAANEG